MKYLICVFLGNAIEAINHQPQSSFKTEKGHCILLAKPLVILISFAIRASHIQAHVSIVITNAQQKFPHLI